MKSLLDIQQDIRNLESSMKEITTRISGINSDFNELRNASQSVQSRGFDYSKIVILAEKLPFGEHPLGYLEDGRACQMYLEMLLNIVRMDFDSETTVNRLIFIQWLQIQSGIDWSLEELLLDACEMQLDSYTEFIGIIPEEYVEDFILDAFIIANMGGAANREILKYLAAMSAVLGITVERVQILSAVAYVVLCRKFKTMRRKQAEKVLNCAQIYRFYMDFDVFESAMRKQRKIVVQYPDSNCLIFKWKVKQGQEVERGDCIAEVYERHSGHGKTRASEKKVSSREWKELTATSSGMLFQFKDKGIHYGVISISADSKEAIKAWVKAGGV